MTKKIIGYQVDDDCGTCPEGMWSFEIYSKDICQEVVDKDPERWKMLTIREGDVEEPTLVISLGSNNIRFRPTGKGAHIDTNLHDMEKIKDKKGENLIYDAELEQNKYNSQIDVIEAMVLAQGCAGIDILSEAYRESLQTVLDKISN